MRNAKRISLFIFILATFALIYLLRIHHYHNLEILKQYKDLLLNSVEKNYWFSALIYICVYIVTVAFSLPGAAVLSMTGGFLFGTLQALPLIILGATMGATLTFLSVRYLIGDWLQQRYEKHLKKFNQELRNYGSSYLLISRLIFIFPFFVINIFAALTQISLFTFIWTTAIGIIPGALIFAFAGNQLHEIESAKDIFTPEVIFVFLLLALFALLPILVKKPKNH
jgi:uncharacterized membrane protein YdjX (TVP38/TMEM64 family)